MGLPSCSHSPHLFMGAEVEKWAEPDKEIDGAEDKIQLTFHMHFTGKENKIAIDFFPKWQGNLQPTSTAMYLLRRHSIQQVEGSHCQEGLVDLKLLWDKGTKHSMMYKESHCVISDRKRVSTTLYLVVSVLYLWDMLNQEFQRFENKSLGNISCLSKFDLLCWEHRNRCGSMTFSIISTLNPAAKMFLKLYSYTPQRLALIFQAWLLDNIPLIVIITLEPKSVFLNTRLII